MSMNFAREQSLLRQRLQAKSTPAMAAERQQRHGTGLTFLGAPEPEVAAAADDLAAAWPQMGRAQMTAFVRTLWNSKIHELRDVGARLLAARAALLEPHDLPLLEQLLGDDADDSVRTRLARDVLGALVVRNKKLWKELKRLAGADDAGRRVAVRASIAAVAVDVDAFARFAELADPLVQNPDPALQAAIDAALAAAAGLQPDAAGAFASKHGRTLPPIAIAPARPAVPAKAVPAKAVAAKAAEPAAAPAADASASRAAKPAKDAADAGAKAQPPKAAKSAAPKSAAAKSAAAKPAAAEPTPRKSAEPKSTAKAPPKKPKAGRGKATAAGRTK